MNTIRPIILTNHIIVSHECVTGRNDVPVVCPAAMSYEKASEQRTALPTPEITMPLFANGDKVVMFEPGKKTFKDRAMPNQPWYARFRKGKR